MAVSAIDRMINRWDENTIKGDQVDWQQWLKPSDVSRIIPAETINEKAKESLLLGNPYEEGLNLPWGKTHGDVIIKPGKVAIWTGFSHHGKTQALKMLTLHGIKNGHKWLIASMEEEIVEIWKDLAIMYVGNDKPSAKYIDKFSEFISGKLWFYDQQGIIEAERMQAVLRYAATRLNVTQSTIDSLMMLGVNRDDYDAQSRFVGELKAIAKDTGQTVHLVAHMRKREGKTGDDQPGGVHDIAGGHEIASKADYVFNVWRDKNKKNDQDPDCVITVEKQRGRINWLGRVGLNYHKPSGQFIDGRYPLEFDK